MFLTVYIFFFLKVFKLKGADRKHKQDREKIQKRTPTEQEKYQPSYECTILTDIPIDSIAPQGGYTPEQYVFLDIQCFFLKIAFNSILTFYI